MTRQTTAARCARILLVALLAGCGAPADVDSSTTAAERLLNAGKIAEAQIELKNLLVKHPADRRLLTLLARAQVDADSPDADAALTAAAQAGGDPGTLAALRVRLLLQQGEYEKLLASLDGKSLALVEPAASLARARALVGLKRCPEAVELARPLRADAAVGSAASIVLAECYARSGNIRGALALLESAVKLDPNAAEAWLARGRLLQVVGRRQEASQAWHKALEAAPGRLGVMQQLTMLASLADLDLAHGDLAGTRAAHERMLAIAPQSAVAILTGAFLQLQDGDAKQAVSTLRSLDTQMQDNPSVRTALAAALLVAGDREQPRQMLTELAAKNVNVQKLRDAVQQIDAAFAATPDSAEYWLHMAAAQNLLGQPGIARAMLTRPGRENEPRITSLSARIALETGDPAGAVAKLEPVAADPSANPALLAQLARSYQANGEFGKADAMFERVAQRTPTGALALARHGARRAGKLSDPNAPLRDWLQHSPGDAVVRATYAESLRLEGDARGAASQYELLVAKNSRNAVLLNNLAWCYWLARDPRALPTARKALELAPQAAAVADTTGWLLLQSGDVKEGPRLIESAWRSGGFADPDIRYHYAAARATTGDRVEARRMLEELLSEVPDFPGRADAATLHESLK
jgi:cellulose synthase operon protein C